MDAQQLELYDIYSLWHIPFWQRDWFKMLVALVVLIIGLLCAWYVYKRFFKKKPAPIPAWQKALQELEQLKEYSIETKDHGKQFYFHITDILKRYIAARFNLNIQAKTDEELVAYLQNQEVLPLVKDGIKDIAQGCVYIKFANQHAMQEQIKRHLSLGFDLVKQTIPEQ